MAEVVGACPKCVYFGDTSQKLLQNSHVIPRAIFKDIAKSNTRSPTHQFISLSQRPDKELHVDQDQGAKPMLCFECEQWINREIEKPVIEWVRNHSPRRFLEFDSALLCRFSASVWWRAMLSYHHYFEHIKYDERIIYRVMSASLRPSQTSKLLTFRMRRVNDSTGRIKSDAWNNVVFMVSKQFPFGAPISGHDYFALIAWGYCWEIFLPRLSFAHRCKFNCTSEGKRRYKISDLDFATDPVLLNHAATQFYKEATGQMSKAFKKRVKGRPLNCGGSSSNRQSIAP